MEMMIWKDVELSDKFCIPKFYYFIVTCFVFFMTFFALISVMTRTNLQDKIVVIIGTFFSLYYCGCTTSFLIKGGKFVKSIKKEANYFVLTNDLNDDFAYTLSDVISVEPSKLSFFDKLWIKINEQEPKLDLIVKKGRRFRITTTMENIDTLKEYLLGKQEEYSIVSCIK